MLDFAYVFAEVRAAVARSRLHVTRPRTSRGSLGGPSRDYNALTRARATVLIVTGTETGGARRVHGRPVLEDLADHHLVAQRGLHHRRRRGHVHLLHQGHGLWPQRLLHHLQPDPLHRHDDRLCPSARPRGTTKGTETNDRTHSPSPFVDFPSDTRSFSCEPVRLSRRTRGPG